MNLRRFIANTHPDPDRLSIDLGADEVYRLLAKRRRRVLLVALYQSHEPVLDEHDVVEWDSDSSVLRSKLPVSTLVDVIRDFDEHTG